MCRHQEEKSFWSKNWGWFVGCGCILPILVIIAIAGVGFIGAKKLVQGNDAFAEALAMAQSHPEVIETLGEPIETKLIGNNFNMTMGQDSGTKLETSCGISGPKAEAQLSFEARQIDDAWVLQFVEVELPDGRTLRLLEPDDPTNDADALPPSSRSRAPFRHAEGRLGPSSPPRFGPADFSTTPG